MYRLVIKRVIDIIFSSLVLMLSAPLLIGVTLVLFFANNGKPFFFQRRPGKNGKVFSIIKFRTMNEKKDKEGNLLSDSERLTKVGNWVRKTSIDEIPQLINVIVGDMSLIGPRPLLVQYLDLYNDFQKRRHEVRPGITGWAQVNGRNAISWEQKFEFDVWYVDNCSLYTDVKIIFKTIKKVFLREGITMEGKATTEYFKGN